MSDTMLWAAYRLARCMVFPSLNEGFGLPVAEALSCGTPVVTSDYGSMAEIAADAGALLVDPRDDHSIAAGMRTLLTDDEVHRRLAAAARARPRRTWEHYASDVWSALVDWSDEKS
jgi:glycosyltransferase involved in cell wall biosynthesis